MRTINDVIAGHPVHVIDHAATAREAAELMGVRQVSALPVIEGDRLVGIVTERDLVQRVMARGYHPEDTTVALVMSRKLVTARLDDSYDAAMARMRRNHVRHLLVVEKERLVGVVSIRDLLVVESVEKSEELELLTSYIYAVPPVLPPLADGEDDWVRSL
jgi:CBS domain-containing protein